MELLKIQRLDIEYDNRVVDIENNRSNTGIRYSEVHKLTVMSMIDAGYTEKEISAIIGCSRDTIQRWKREEKGKTSTKLARSLTKRHRQKSIIASNLLLDEALKQDKLDKASTMQLVTSSKIVLDAQKLVEGEESGILDQYREVEELEGELSLTEDELIELEMQIEEMGGNDGKDDDSILVDDSSSSIGSGDNLGGLPF